LNTKCVFFISSKIAVRNMFHSKKQRARYDNKCLVVFMQSTGHSCQIAMKLESPRRVFQKYINIKFHENPSTGSRVVPCEQTDMTKLTVAFCSFANAPKILIRLCGGKIRWLKSNFRPCNIVIRFIDKFNNRLERVCSQTQLCH